ncbi:hypothetical protein XFF4834R_chr14710 [Xanthomonas citri pv. fuscans]|nr:hypothetical protein XFF4834R_chr14710 [Xanthomonas citri pv. fuscans]
MAASTAAHVDALAYRRNAVPRYAQAWLAAAWRRVRRTPPLRARHARHACMGCAPKQRNECATTKPRAAAITSPRNR